MLDTIIDAVKLLGKDGDIKMVLVRYQKQMIMCDVGPSDFRKSERVHRDLVYSTILANPALEAYAEYQVAKVSNTLGQAYPLIEVGYRTPHLAASTSLFIHPRNSSSPSGRTSISTTSNSMEQRQLKLTRFPATTLTKF